MWSHDALGVIKHIKGYQNQRTVSQIVETDYLFKYIVDGDLR